jgi:hypothetical protein
MKNPYGERKEAEYEDNFVQLDDYEPLNIVQKNNPVKTIITNASTKASEEDPKLQP